MKTSRRILVACLAAVLSGTATADHSPASDLMSLSIEELMTLEIETASKLQQPLIDAPAAVVVITADDIRTNGYRTLAEVLGAMRGLYVSYDRYFSYVGVRGVSPPGDFNTRFLLLVDGIRQNDSVYHQAMVGVESPVDVDLIDRVEFVPGAGSAIYGSNAIFGVINVVTRRSIASHGTEVALSAGDYGTGKLRVTNGGVTESGREWLLSATGYRQQGQDLDYTALGGTAHDLDEDRSTTFFGKFRADGVTVTATASSRTKENPTASYSQVFNAPGSEATDELAGLAASYQREITTGLELVGQVSAQYYRFHGDYVYDAPPLYINRDLARGTAWNAGMHAISEQLAGHRLVVGAEYRRDSDVRQQNFDVDPYASYLDKTVNLHRAGVFVEDEIGLGDHWTTNLGLRYDHFSDARSRMSPRGALIYRPRPLTAVKLLYGEAYRTPNAYERFYETDTPGGFRVNPNLRQETIRTREVVVEHAPDVSQRWVLSAFRNDLSDLIVQQYDAIADRLFFENTESVKAVGVEAEWTGHFDGDLRVKVSAAWNRAEAVGSGERLINSPARLAKASLSAPVVGQRLRAGVEVQAMSSRGTGLGTVPGFAITNLTLLAPRVSGTWEFSASVYNIFDRAYSDPVGEEFLPLDRIEQNGRDFRLRVSYLF